MAILLFLTQSFWSQRAVLQPPPTMAFRPALCASCSQQRGVKVRQSNCLCECALCMLARVDCLCGRMAPDEIHFLANREWNEQSAGAWHTVGMEQLFMGTLRDLVRSLEGPPEPSPVQVSGSLDATLGFRDYKYEFARFVAENHCMESLEDRWCIFEKNSGKPIWFCRLGFEDDWLSSIPTYKGCRAVLTNGEKRSIRVAPLRAASQTCVRMPF